MAYTKDEKKFVGLTASVAIVAADVFKFVKFGATANTVVLCSATTDDAIGVILAAAAAGEAVEVAHTGFVPLQKSATAIVQGDPIGPDVNGRADKYGAADTTKHIKGRCIEAVSGTGALMTAYIDCLATRTLA